MEIIRKSIKVMVISVGIFIILTLMSAALMVLTELKESWSHQIIMICMVISASFAGVLEAKIIGRKMLFVFLTAAIFFAMIIYGSVYMIFNIL